MCCVNQLAQGTACCACQWHLDALGAVVTVCSLHSPWQVCVRGRVHIFKYLKCLEEQGGEPQTHHATPAVRGWDRKGCGV